MGDLPSPVVYGTVKVNVGKLVGDITGTPTPDIQALTGKCRIRPNGIKNMTIVATPNYVLSTPPEMWDITGGKLRDKSGNEGVRLIASSSPGKFPEYVQYVAEFFIDGLDKQYQPSPVYFDVIASSTVDLALLVNTESKSPVIKVNSYEDRSAVLVALASSQEAKTDAQAAATAAALSAAAAAQSAANAHAAIITLQGVGTPVPPGTPAGTVVVRTA